MKFSLVTTCLNEVKSFDNWRAGVLAQTRPPDEIVVVDGESRDGTTEALRAWAAKDKRLRLRIKKCSVARGRNIAITIANNECVVSTDMGVRLDARWLEEMVRPFEDDASVQVVVGAYAVDESSVVSPAARAEYYIAGDGGPFCADASGRPAFRRGVVPSNRSVAYYRKVWRELGGLPEDLTRCADDSVFGRQILHAGYRMALAPKAMVYWTRPQRLREFWKEQRGYGRGDGEAAIKMPFAFRLYRKGRVPRILVAPLTGLRTAMKQLTWSRLAMALRKGDLPGLLYMPLLAFGNGYHFGRGYLEGFSYGEKHCQACRSRLANYAGL
ncbi:MAG TPA: glycosyltransferase [Planctomycetota bacterium]|nr:glycosyltransferase [Planctomycetota bacterium]